MSEYMQEMTSFNSQDTLDYEGNETPETIFQILYNTFIFLACVGFHNEILLY
jgi:hypothetical protein